MTLDCTEITSPIGIVRMLTREGRVCALNFADRWTRTQAALVRRFGIVEWRQTSGPSPLADRLRAYFDGDLHALDPIAVDPGGTPFQSAIWKALRAIAPGSTVAYRDLARTVGSPAAVRAVGAANGANPVGIVIPCHRVIGANGRLTGYAGGVERKRWLLRHEGIPS